MKLSTILFLVSTSFFLLFACKAKQPGVVINKKIGAPLYFLSKGPCFGRCPVFTLTIMDNGVAEYHGTSNTKLLGTYQKTLSNEALTTLDQLFTANDFTTFEDDYKSMLPDLPLVKIGYAQNDSMLIKMGKEDRPEELMKLQYALDNIAGQQGWELIKPLPTIDEEAAKMVEDKLDKSKIIIKHKPGTQVPMWFNAQREAYGIRIVDKVAEEPGGWIVTYSMNEYEADEVMQALQSDEKIVSAEFLKIE